MLDKFGKYVVYLRKSRKDVEAELHGQGETLARHKKILTDLAKNYNIQIMKYYEEIVSGDSIAARPVMQQLLDEVDDGMWDGVLVIEIERLARGDTKDQGIVAESFKYSSTLIITPSKIYDPNNEFDEEYFEFGLFMSRREYKTITRRLKAGINAAKREGKWPHNCAPYGYTTEKLSDQKGYKLKIVPEEAAVIKKIFQLYLNGFGYNRIVDELSRLGITKNGVPWKSTAIPSILMNEVYTGKIVCGFRAKKKVIENGIVKYKYEKRNLNAPVYEGLHEAIIDEELFRQVQKKKSMNKSKPVKLGKEMTNPLSSLVYCSCCGRKMVRRPSLSHGVEFVGLICPTRGCENHSSRLSVVEKAVLEFLQNYVDTQKANISENTTFDNISVLESQCSSIELNISSLQQQLDKQYDLLEQGIYDTDVFIKRSEDVKAKIENAKNDMDKIIQSISKEKARIDQIENFIPNIENILKTYETCSPYEKNQMLCSVIEKIVYTKKEKSKRNESEMPSFELSIYPRVHGF